MDISKIEHEGRAQIVQAQNYWRSIQAGRDAAFAYRRNLQHGCSYASSIAGKIISKGSPPLYLETALRELSFALGRGFIVRVASLPDEELRIDITSDDTKDFQTAITNRKTKHCCLRLKDCVSREVFRQSQSRESS